MEPHTLTPLMQRFIMHFGEMGSRWGINRTVGQIYALLYISGRALNADEIADYLSFSRSNVSMGLKELQSWRLVKLLHRPNDRREYFEPPGDIWDIFKALLEERRRREIEPTLSMLRDALLEAPASADDKAAQKRMREMYELIELSSSWFDEVQRLQPETLVSLMKMGAKVKKLLDVREKFRFGGKDGAADGDAAAQEKNDKTDKIGRE
ncbi:MULTISPECIES: GbsR/MarR family transcriptional regulator [unclassified Herbaspirillum]|uniref:GbsR/MarR family transcriptional regulator n=1 Tax=unclassified Herbaspirillum TaxID=2624150 RepID=UPI0011683EAD|nr:MULTISPECIES: GbsR/MarR family transcriptional regulator [unclassified Herbaspirillum]MBB5390880.1 DNA-binding transcriptional regulator GbsR (MarR family) [Herbaspirillum sp. SJZ102]TQK06404.1 DNA-binding transcriptional regulator GbsR (MarR family) [Herbaspirillum sp. SJZ130]TQK12118.1 DNA-binding transcriptional regulator GbsR (MarR family) [Herbaspirillum sp. SJZ106]